MLILESNVARQFASLDSIQTGTVNRRRSEGKSPINNTGGQKFQNTRLTLKPQDKRPRDIRAIRPKKAKAPKRTLAKSWLCPGWP